MKSPSWSPFDLTKSPENQNIHTHYFKEAWKKKRQRLSNTKLKEKKYGTCVLKEIHPTFIVRPKPDTPKRNNYNILSGFTINQI